MFDSPWNQLKHHREYKISAHHHYYGFSPNMFTSQISTPLGQPLWNTTELGVNIFASDAECAMLTHPLKVARFRLFDSDYDAVFYKTNIKYIKIIE